MHDYVIFRELVTDFWIQHLQSTAELSETHVTFLTINQGDEEKEHGHQKDKDKDRVKN